MLSNRRFRCFGSCFINLIILTSAMVLASGVTAAYGQECPDPPPQSSGTHRFRHQGETFEIPITLGDCQPLALELRWANGRSHGSNFRVTFLDGDNQPIYAKEIPGFYTGTFQFPFANLEPQRWQGSVSMISAPTTVVIQTVRPFAFPASISYTVRRAAGRVRPRQPKLDDNSAMKLRTAPGRLLSQGQGRGASASGEPITYKLEELPLAQPVEVEMHGRKETVQSVFRLVLMDRGPLRNAGLIWIDDTALSVFRRNDATEVGTLIYDRSILKDGAEISVSRDDGSQMYSLTEALRLPERLKASTQARKEEGNDVVSIHSAIRVIGATRQPLVQIELKTNRPFPARDAVLQLQIGKRFFLNELSGDPSGRTLNLTLTESTFAELKQGAEIVAFFGKPDRSGFAGQDIWYFGRLDKDALRR